MDKITVVSEKELTGIDIHHHGIRMDLYVEAYETLPEYISIWILPYDPFWKNCMLYTVKNCVEEFPELVYNDGVKKLFLYVGGELGGTEKLKSLLQYFSASNTGNVTDTDLEHLHSIVENTKHNQKVGKRYMTLQDMIDYEKKESFDEGVALGREGGIFALINSLKNLNIPNDQILDQLMQNFSLTMEEAKSYLNKTN